MTTPRRAAAVLIVLGMAWLSPIVTAAHADETNRADAHTTNAINLYSTREPPLLEPVIASFTAATGIKVNLVTIADNLVARVKAEGDTSPADVLMTIGLDKTSQFSANALTQPIASAALDKVIPAQLRGADWIALSVRPRVVMMRGDSAQGAIRYEDLADARWHGKLCMRSPWHQNNVALVAAFVAHHGADATATWLAGLKANLAFAPDGKDNDVIRQLAERRCEIGIANTVALAQLRDGREGAEYAAWANQVTAVPTSFADGGAHVNLTGAAIARHAPHREAALKFLAFLVTPDAQKIYAAAELEYPVNAAAAPAPLVAAMGAFPIDTLPIDTIAAHQKTARELIGRAGFAK